MKAYFKVAASIALLAACASARDDQEWFNANGAQDWAPINIFGFEVAYAF